MIVLKYQDSTTDEFFENVRRNLSFWGGVGGGVGKTLSKKIGCGPNIVDSPTLHFMFLVDMRFTSKLGCCLVMQNVSFVNPQIAASV